MDEAALASKTAKLPEMFADRLPQAELDGLRSMAGGGEWGELLDLLMVVLQTGAPVTSTERDEVREVLAGWGLPASRADELTVRS